MMRNLDADEFFESFMIAAITAILGIRVFLYLTGYPTVGGDSLHIAHMLWGGLLMLVALLLLLGFLGKSVKSTAAVIGGLGWGTFIDELGKFLTHDNNYFYEPTFALIYVLFVVLYVAWDALHSRVASTHDAVANALELTLEAVCSDMDAEERTRALALLEQADTADPLVESLRRALAQVELAPPGRPGLLGRTRHAVRSIYRSLVKRRWFVRSVIVFFVLHSANLLIQAMLLVRQATASLLLVGVGLLVAAVLLEARLPRALASIRQPLAFTVLGVSVLGGAALARQLYAALDYFAWAEVVAAIVPAVFVLTGVARLRRSRIEGFRAFKTAVLIIIFVTQFFAFYHQQLVAVFGLLVNVTVWITLRTMIQQEERLLAVEPASSAGSPAAGL